MTKRFENKVAIVTGASLGIGRATALQLAREGAHVVGCSRRKPKLDELEQRIKDEGGAFTGYAVDVNDPDAVQQFVRNVIDEHGRLDVLVNAAGTIHRADALGTTDEDWRRVLGVNIDGMFYLSRAAVDYMAKRGRGTIINFGSIWGGVASAGSTAYCVSKGAVHQLTRAMALDHVHQGIRINAVAPGEVRTPMLSSQRATPPTEQDLQALADAHIPMKRLAEPSEIANVVVFLASNDASYMTGEIVHVDAGYTAR